LSFSFSTGSENLRDIEILKNWYVFEPMTDERFAVSGGIYSTLINQDKVANFSINTSSVSMDGPYISVEKVRYVFDREVDATTFLNNIGIDNISTYYEQNYRPTPTSGIRIQHVVEVIDFPKLSLPLDVINFSTQRGFRVSVFEEDGNNLIQMDREVVQDDLRRLINEPFTKYFEVLEQND
jgi:hypothetical protein